MVSLWYEFWIRGLRSRGTHGRCGAQWSPLHVAWRAQLISSYDTKETELFSRPYFANATGTLEGYLLDVWFTGNLTYDALFFGSLPPVSQVGLESSCATPLGSPLSVSSWPGSFSPARLADLSKILSSDGRGQKLWRFNFVANGICRTASDAGTDAAPNMCRVAAMQFQFPTDDQIYRNCRLLVALHNQWQYLRFSP